MKTLVVVDIDGTICNAERRFKEAGPEPDRSNKIIYDAWVNRIQNAQSLMEDKPVPGMRQMVWSLLRETNSADVILLTSREERWREVTNAWLKKNSFPYDPWITLSMRGNGNYTEGVDFKEIVIEQLMKERGCEEVVVIDDDGKGDIEVMCKRRGWTFLKARSGGQL